ncbi:MAG TPA: rod-binding protein [Devosia sp.]|jgi:flagellar protein FlgJ|nr:rod-binding protein [Devosia sp.]
MVDTVPLPKLDPKTPGYKQAMGQAKALEGEFLNTLTKEMFSSIKTDDKNFGGGFGEQTWRDMQAEQFADAMADRGGIGLADQLMPTLLSLQEASRSTSSVTGFHS